MAQTGDIQIEKKTTTTGTYQYMLVEREGVKAWRYRPVFTQPPDMTKGFINCTIYAAPKMRQSTNGTVITTRVIATLLTELASLHTEGTTNLELTGPDTVKYYVFMSKTPIDVRATYDLSGRQETYEIDLEFIEQHT